MAGDATGTMGDDEAFGVEVEPDDADGQPSSERFVEDGPDPTATGPTQDRANQEDAVPDRAVDL